MILALSSSTEFFSLALFNNPSFQLKASTGLFSYQKFQEIGLEHIHSFLLANQCPLNQLKALAVDTGPGGFTSLRLGVATIKTLAYVLSLPIYEACSLDLIATHFLNPKNIIVALDGKQKRLYTRFYHGDNQKSSVMDLTPTQLEEMIFQKAYSHYQTLGDGFLAYPHLQNKDYSYPHYYHYPMAQNMPLCWMPPQEQNLINPRYYRKTQAEEKKHENLSY